MVTLQPINLKQPSTGHREALRNLFNLWHHDLSIMDCTLFPHMDDNGYYEYTATDVYFDSDDTVRDKLLAYFIRYNNELAGFCIISKPPYILKQDCDYCVGEFYITGNFRRKGVAGDACRLIFAKHPGRYCLETIENNTAAKRFWTKLINSVGTNILIERDGTLFSFTV